MSGALDKAAGQAAGYLEGVKFDAFIDKAQQTAQALAGKQAESKESLEAELVNTGDKPIVLEKKKEPLPKPAVRKTEKAVAADQRKAPAEEIDKRAKDYNQSHQELGEERLKQLHYEIKEGDSPEAIIAKALALFPKKSQASDALNFLLLTTTKPLRDAILAAKTKFDADNTKEIEQGRPITEIARKGATEGIDTAKSLDAKISDMVAKQEDALVVFEQLLREFPSKENRDKFIKLMLSTMGAQTRGNIESPQLGALCTQIRATQAFISPYSDFEKAHSEMVMSFKRAGLTIPANLTTETLVVAFLRLCGDRYYSSSKVMDIANRLAAAA